MQVLVLVPPSPLSSSMALSIASVVKPTPPAAGRKVKICASLAPPGFAVCAARAQARTAVHFVRKHPHWRVRLATGQSAVNVWWSGVARSMRWPQVLERIAGAGANGESRAPATTLQRWAAARLARAAYYDELARADRAQ